MDKSKMKEKGIKVRPSKKDLAMALREDIISDIWSANKKVVDGKWYVELSQVCEIIGGSYDE